ncbi:MAG: hypothetical protein MUD01_28715, partial [Chloroflexaceae bacterium]|nr:hypothetical protein [Chloroflexaceae bacterium]
MSRMRQEATMPFPFPIELPTWLWRQLVLVPEAGLLVLVLGLHMLLGSPLLTAFLGLLLVGWFAARNGLLFAARHTFNTASYDEAEGYTNLALKLYPYSADGYYLRGSLELARGNAEAAETALRQAIALYPDHAPIHAALSGVFLEIGQVAEARQEAVRALAIDERCAAAHLHIATADQVQGIPLDEVELYLREAQRHPAAPADAAALRCALAGLLLEQQRAAEVQLTLRGVETLLKQCPTPQQASLYFQLGELRQALGELESARTCFHTSETLD